MRGTRVAITLFFFADGLLIGSWAARIPAVQRPGGADERPARARALRDVAGSARRDAARRVAGRADRQPSRHRRRARRRRRLALPRVARERPRRARRGALRLRRGLRRDQRLRERAGPRARAAVRALDPLVVPRGVQRRRVSRAPASARSPPALAIGPRAHFGALALVLAVGGSRGGRRLLPPDGGRRPAGADPRPPAAGPARARRGGVLHAARRGSRSRLERRLPLATRSAPPPPWPRSATPASRSRWRRAAPSATA